MAYHTTTVRDTALTLPVIASVRATLSRVAVLLTLVAISLLLFLATGVQAGAELRDTGTHVVGQGETLWEIAATHTSPGGDVRATLYDIQKLNGIDGSVIHAGTALVVPGG